MNRPNILFILSDDQGAWAMHCAGNDEIITPNLDRLAAAGVRFENCFCASPVCSPARAAIVTGEMPSCNGVLDWICGGNADTEKYPEMADHDHFKTVDKPIEYLSRHPSYIEQLAKNGYNCALSGKWHLGNSEQAKEGFKKWFTIMGGGCKYCDADTYENGRFHRNNRYVTDIITDKAVECLSQMSDEAPFYLSVHYTAPHSPWSAENHPQEYLDLYKDCKFHSTPDLPIHKNQIKTCPIGDSEEKRRENLVGYYAAITAMDAGIGRILTELEKSGKAENTVVIFTSDNGMNMGHHGIWGKGNGTFPQNMYDSAVKVPMIIAHPLAENKGIVNTRLVSHCDLFSTILEMAGIQPQLNEKQPGNSVCSSLYNEDDCVQEQGCIGISSEYGTVRMLRTSHRKLVYRYPDGPDEYYDMVSDPDETVNLIDSTNYQREIADKRHELEVWFEKYSCKETDARQFVIVGRGQKKLCTETDAFEKEFKYYYENK